MGVKRIIVDESIADEFTQKLVRETKKIKMGNPMDKNTVLGTLIDEEVLDAEKNDVRTVMHFHPALAPVKIGVLPLSKKLNEGAEKIFLELSKAYNCEFDDRGNIGNVLYLITF